MQPSGTLENDGTTLVLTRTVEAPVQQVWACLTRSEQLAKWYGSWSGDPREGFVSVQMSDDQGSPPPIRHRILTARPPRLLSVRTGMDEQEWMLTVQLSEDDGRIRITLRQENFDPEALPSMGPGWEWYLDRLVAAVTDEQMPTIDDFESDYMKLAGMYLTMVE